jgi:branched-chain amino acid transport system substrate-binding protein
MKKIKILFAISAILFAFAGCNSCNQTSKNEIVKIGGVFPMTGNGSQYGQDFKEGSELALANAIKVGSIKNDEVQLVIEDGQGDPTKSINAFNKLIDNDNISAGLTALSSVTLAIKPVANNRHVTIINANAFSSDIEDRSDYCFSILPNATDYGEYIGEITFTDLHQKEIGIVYRNDASGLSFTDGFSKAFLSLGGQILFKETHDPNQSDYKSLINKLRNSEKRPKYIFMPSYGNETAQFIKQAGEGGYNIKIITYQSFFIPETIQLAGQQTENVLFLASAFNPYSSDSITSQLRQQLKQKYNSDDLNYYVAAEYDAMNLLIKAVANGNKSGEAIRKYMGQLKEFKGITGNIQFNKWGGCSMPLKLYTVRNRKFVLFTL